MRYLGYTLGDPSAPIPPPTPKMANMGAFMEEATEAESCWRRRGGPLDEAAKVRYRGGEFTVLDGPFTEAKELVGGWALMECRDKAEAIEWTKRFLALGARASARSGRSSERPLADDHRPGWSAPAARAARPFACPGTGGMVSSWRDRSIPIRRPRRWSGWSGPPGRHAGPLHRRRRPGRGTGPGRRGRGAGTVARFRRPGQPRAWLTTVAKRRAIDLFRRNRELKRKYAQIGRDIAAAGGQPGRSIRPPGTTSTTTCCG